MRRIAAAALLCMPLLCAALAGCGDGSTGTSSTSTTQETPPQATQDNNPMPGMTMQADPSIVDTHPIAFQSWTKLADNRIAVHFETGSPVCYGVSAATTETSSSVTVALKSGTKPSAVGKMCPMLALMATLEVALKAPLDSRTVVSAQ